MESVLLNVVVVVATGSAVLKFALFEWEGVMQAWDRAKRRGRRQGPREKILSKQGQG